MICTHATIVDQALGGSTLTFLVFTIALDVHAALALRRSVRVLEKEERLLWKRTPWTLPKQARAQSGAASSWRLTEKACGCQFVQYDNDQRAARCREGGGRRTKTRGAAMRARANFIV